MVREGSVRDGEGGKCEGWGGREGSVKDGEGSVRDGEGGKCEGWGGREV